MITEAPYDIDDVNLAKIKIRESLGILLGLNLQGDITAETYNYLSEQIFYVLSHLVFPILEDFEEKEEEKKEIMCKNSL